MLATSQLLERGPRSTLARRARNGRGPACRVGEVGDGAVSAGRCLLAEGRSENARSRKLGSRECWIVPRARADLTLRLAAASGDLRYDRGARRPHDRVDVGAIAVAIDRLQGPGKRFARSRSVRAAGRHADLERQQKPPRSAAVLSLSDSKRRARGGAYFAPGDSYQRRRTYGPQRPPIHRIVAAAGCSCATPVGWLGGCSASCAVASPRRRGRHTRRYCAAR